MTAPAYLVRNVSARWMRGTWHSLRDAVAWAIGQDCAPGLSCTEAVELVEQQLLLKPIAKLGNAEVLRV